MITTFRPTLRQVFGFSLLGLLVGLALLFYLVLHGLEKTLLRSSERYRDLASREVALQVTNYLNEAPVAVTHFEKQLKYGLIDSRNTDSVKQGLLSLLLANDNISEATLTSANSTGNGQAGNIVIDQASAGQIEVLRSTTAGEFIVKKTWFNGNQFVSQCVNLRSQSAAEAMSAAPIVASVDPTAHPTFQTAVYTDYGQIISTDLHWSQLDEALPEGRRRVEVSVQKAIEDSHAHFIGVLRVGLMKSQIDGAVQLHITDQMESDPHLIFLCDNQGRLITGFGKGDVVAVSGDDLRVVAHDAPPMVTRALQEPALKDINSDRPHAATSFHLGNEVYLCTFRYLPGTQDWIVGIVVPRDFYLGSLLQIRRQVLWASLVLIIVIIMTGGLIIRSVVIAHALILQETAKMNEFDFSPTHNVSYVRDVERVLVGLEKAKTAMRAMSKYVPINLVRQLYQKGEEPVLGGDLAELSVLFTDIKDFTVFAESIPPDDLAEILGRYLQVMAETLQGEKGTIDKYIGDAVMTFWNAPEAVPNHEILACRAALRCHDALQRLYDSPRWGNDPRFETRFGLHRCLAMVGHFGAPDRLNYTAIGDGINLASRLEGLNKYYGTHIIASESIQAAAKDVFEFRLLDRVAVKGKAEGIVIYELLAERIAGKSSPEFVNRYEHALASYQRGEFKVALEMLESQIEDSPSRVLADRCRTLLKTPHPNWNGVHLFDQK
ncbi:adenylate/guanylate cyclase domain-containing protein [Methylacidiphilales bacterium]|nr:adenylate/guanylate cyclase domain-containing protein [Candidatus Methylacidiphilales bacterium]